MPSNKQAKPKVKAPRKKGKKQKKPKLPRYPREGTILGYVKHRGEGGYWPDLEWAPNDCFVPVKR